jgi:hypothetical protein
MAPNVAREVIQDLQRGDRIIDPMCGSGTTLRQGVEAGLDCVGYDIDPLAVLMASSWTSLIPAYRLLHDANIAVERARSIQARDVTLPWHDDATDDFARYWFAEPQFGALARLSQVLRHSRLSSRHLLRLAMSRLIVTKDRGASLARDVSHSRPHRVMDVNTFDVYSGFLRAARQIAHSLEPELIRGSARVSIGDARALDERPHSFDAAITSPPYLNAIDYIRGHRLVLIWFGHPLLSLREVRSRQVGSERSLAEAPFEVARFVQRAPSHLLEDRYVGWLRRYATDMLEVMQQLHRTVRRSGRVVVVVGNSTIRGANFDNAGVLQECANRVGLVMRQRREREIPARRRYLPPPGGGSPLGDRMRSESVLTFVVE